ncbi:hypothetical protein WJX72_004160 [[Myrmecia] bisecta]|uniref:MYND-type domain-containing protein n=1 Tax=[Myrmecia] bisecta TaxID=41462 RepID=A0AAW1PNJ6_9CHLO
MCRGFGWQHPGARTFSAVYTDWKTAQRIHDKLRRKLGKHKVLTPKHTTVLETDCTHVAEEFVLGHLATDPAALATSQSYDAIGFFGIVCPPAHTTPEPGYSSIVWMYAPIFQTSKKLIALEAKERGVSEAEVRQEVHDRRPPPQTVTQRKAWAKAAFARCHSTCAGCNTSASGGAKLPSCAKCGMAHYCSKSCQTMHWKEHRAKCKQLLLEYRAIQNELAPSDWGVVKR